MEGATLTRDEDVGAIRASEMSKVMVYALELPILLVLLLLLLLLLTTSTNGTASTSACNGVVATISRPCNGIVLQKINNQEDVFLGKKNIKTIGGQ